MTNRPTTDLQAYLVGLHEGSNPRPNGRILFKAVNSGLVRDGKKGRYTLTDAGREWIGATKPEPTKPEPKALVVTDKLPPKKGSRPEVKRGHRK